MKYVLASFAFAGLVLVLMAGCGLITGGIGIPKACSDFCNATFKCVPAGGSSGVTEGECTDGCEVQSANSASYATYVACTDGKACTDWYQCVPDGGLPDALTPVD